MLCIHGEQKLYVGQPTLGRVGSKALLIPVLSSSMVMDVHTTTTVNAVITSYLPILIEV